MSENQSREIDFSTLKPGAHIHLIGICGTAMGSLAGLLKEMGFKVTGSDQNVYPPMSTQLESLGIEIKKGYKKENLEPKPDLVIVGNVIQRVFEESQALLASDIPYTSLPRAMGEFLIADRKSIVVAGTHGKTTTTSMMSWVAECCNQKPGFMIGGIPKNWGKSFHVPDGDVFVIEGDEYDTAFWDKVPKFIYYKPKYTILTSIEFDHADIYNSMEDVRKAFVMLVDRIPEDGVLVANGGSEEIRNLIKSCKGRVVTYGGGESDYTYANVQKADGITTFEVIKAGQKIDQIEMSVFGEYNIENALASYALAIEMGWSIEGVKKGLADFSGVKRRQEIIGQPNEITIIDDFAHHPTAVGMTIQCVQEHYPNRKVISVFEPRSATSRRKVFENDFIEAFSHAQNFILAKPYDQSRIDESDRFSAERVLTELKGKGLKAQMLDDSDAIAEEIKRQAEPGDVVLIMSNGGFDGLYEKLLKSLS